MFAPLTSDKYDADIRHFVIGASPTTLITRKPRPSPASTCPDKSAALPDIETPPAVTHAGGAFLL